jgi:hypothetical protein
MCELVQVLAVRAHLEEVVLEVRQLALCRDFRPAEVELDTTREVRTVVRSHARHGVGHSPEALTEHLPASWPAPSLPTS